MNREIWLGSRRREFPPYYVAAAIAPYNKPYDDGEAEAKPRVPFGFVPPTVSRG